MNKLILLFLYVQAQHQVEKAMIWFSMCCHNENGNQSLYLWKWIFFPLIFQFSILYLDYRCWSLLRPHLKSGYTYVFPLVWKSKVDSSSVNRKIALISKMIFLLVVWAKIVQMIGYTALKVTFIYVCKSSLSRKKVDIQPFWPFGQKNRNEWPIRHSSYQ